MATPDFSNKKILVIGDICLDRNRFVDVVKGSSREGKNLATMRYVHGKPMHKDQYSPGAAGNIAFNLATLGAKVSVAGVIGKDINGIILKKKLKTLNINTSDLKIDNNRATITFEKCYNISDISMPIQRWDTENYHAIDNKLLKELNSFLQLNAKNYDAIILQDHCEVDESTAIITDEILRTATMLKGKVKTFGSSRNRIKKFKDFYTIIPNDNEAVRAIGKKVKNFSDELPLKEVKQTAELLYKKNNPENLVITLGKRGAFLKNSKIKKLIPTQSLQGKIDITGCGDTFLSTFTLADLSGFKKEEAIALANKAAGITATILGTTGCPTKKQLEEK